MALFPKRVKFRKQQRGKRRGMATSGATLNFGQYGLQALENAWVENRQIEASRVAITHHIRQGGKIWVRIFPDKPVTKKPAETRMGKGKGAPEFWVAVVKRGRVLFEIEGVPIEIAREAMRLAAFKLPIRTRFITRQKDTDMATIKAEEIRNLAEKEILEKLNTLQKELYELVYQNQTARDEKHHRIKELRRNIARCYTILREKQNADSGKR